MFRLKEDPNILIVENNSVINVQATTSNASPTQKTSNAQIAAASNLLDVTSTQSPSKSSTKQIAQIIPEQLALQNYHYTGATIYVHP